MYKERKIFNYLDIALQAMVTYSGVSRKWKGP